MKKLFIISFLSVFVFSCSNEDTYSILDKFDTSNFSTKQFVGNIVAFQKNNEVKLGIKDNKLLESFNNYSKKLGLGLSAVSLQLEKIDNKDYIRFFNKGGSVSTVALLKDIEDSNGRYAIGETVCTTTSCASCCGCVPDGNYCSPCDFNTADCKRTTSG